MRTAPVWNVIRSMLFEARLWMRRDAKPWLLNPPWKSAVGMQSEARRDDDVVQIDIGGVAARAAQPSLVLARSVTLAWNFADEGTVKLHVSHLLEQRQTADRTHAVTLARQRGLVALEERRTPASTFAPSRKILYGPPVFRASPQRCGRTSQTGPSKRCSSPRLNPA